LKPLRRHDRLAESPRSGINLNQSGKLSQLSYVSQQKVLSGVPLHQVIPFALRLKNQVGYFAHSPMAARTFNAEFRQSQYNSAFVLMEYFGYLRRDADASGYQFWLNALNNAPGNYRGMVCSFVTSAEYQQRFSLVVAHGNAECGQEVSEGFGTRQSPATLVSNGR